MLDAWTNLRASLCAVRQQQKKPSFPIGEGLRTYLRRYRRERELPVTYDRLRRFADSIPFNDAKGRPTLWETVFYDPLEMESAECDAHSSDGGHMLCF